MVNINIGILMINIFSLGLSVLTRDFKTFQSVWITKVYQKIWMILSPLKPVHFTPFSHISSMQYWYTIDPYYYININLMDMFVLTHWINWNKDNIFKR